MAQFTGEGRQLDRRGFLKGSAMFAAAAVGLGLTTPLFAQDAPKTAEEKKKAEEEEKAKAEKAKAEKAKEGQQTKDEPKADGQTAKQDPSKLYDKNGIEYRVCERCGGNMYREEKTWTCEQCGLSYVE